MTTAHWPTQNWPEGVPHEIDGYDIPLFQLLDAAARDYPDQTYTIFNDASRTYAQVKDTADRVANFLHAKGIRKGDRVAIFLPNLPHYPAIFFGILKAGAICVTCNPLYTPAEINYQLKDAGAKVLFCMDHPQFYPTAEKAIQGTDVKSVVVCNVKAYLPWLKGLLGGLLGKIPHAERHATGHLMFDDVVNGAQPAPPVVDVDPSEDLALIIYTCFSGGAPLPPEVCRQFEEKTGAIIFEGYGLSETAPLATANPSFTDTRKIGSIGFPVPGTDLKILDAETSQAEMPQGEDGEVAICGPQVMQGYWNKPDETAQVFREIDGRRFFLTGDIGHVDQDGYVVITDRKKDMILVGGFNVYPREVEDILIHPSQGGPGGCDGCAGHKKR